MAKQDRRSPPPRATARVLRPPIVGPAQILGFAILVLAAWLAVAAARADEFAALTAHAGWCISGADGEPPVAAATLFGHCALCWASAGAAFVGAGLLATGPRR